MAQVNVRKAEEQYETDYEALVEKYGSHTAIPKDEEYIVRETLRATYCLATNPSGSVREVLRYYSVDERVWGNFVDDHNVGEPVKKVKRTDKYQSIIDWTKDHLFEQITAQTIMEVGEISYPTALKFISDRPDIFRKIKRGTYEIRDPKTDRQAEK